MHTPVGLGLPLSFYLLKGQLAYISDSIGIKPLCSSSFEAYISFWIRLFLYLVEDPSVYVKYYQSLVNVGSLVFFEKHPNAGIDGVSIRFLVTWPWHLSQRRTYAFRFP